MHSLNASYLWFQWYFCNNYVEFSWHDFWNFVKWKVSKSSHDDKTCGNFKTKTSIDFFVSETTHVHLLTISQITMSWTMTVVSMRSVWLNSLLWKFSSFAWICFLGVFSLRFNNNNIISRWRWIRTHWCRYSSCFSDSGIKFIILNTQSVLQLSLLFESKQSSLLWSSALWESSNHGMVICKVFGMTAAW